MRRGVLLALHAAALLLILIGALWTFTYFNGSALRQFYVVIAAVVAHIVWGIIYHSLNKQLTAGLLLEYVLVGALVLLLFSWTLFA